MFQRPSFTDDHQQNLETLFIAFCPAGYKTFRNYETNGIYCCNVTLNLATVDLIYNLQVTQFEKERRKKEAKAFLNAKKQVSCIYAI